MLQGTTERNVTHICFIITDTCIHIKHKKGRGPESQSSQASSVWATRGSRMPTTKAFTQRKAPNET